MKNLKLIWPACLMAVALSAGAVDSTDGVASITDASLLASKGPSWWYISKPSPAIASLQDREPTEAEKVVIGKARAMLAKLPIKVMALMDGNRVVHTEFKEPANADSLLMGMSMGKTVTSMGVGKAICAGKLSFTDKAGDVVPELAGKDLGKATVRDLLRMASGTVFPNTYDVSVWTKEQELDWNTGKLNLLSTITEDRVSKAQKTFFGKEVQPGERTDYKGTDPIAVSVMVARSVGMPWSQWLQEQVFDSMGAAKAGLYGQDRSLNGLAESGMRLRLEDWMRFALWVKQSSKEQGCFGDYVRAAMSPQISNGPVSQRRSGKLFDSYGYFMWTENVTDKNSVWAVGHGGQRIGWNLKNDRMIVVFSNMENVAGEVYSLGKEWSALQPLTAKP